MFERQVMSRDLLSKESHYLYIIKTKYILISSFKIINNNTQPSHSEMQSHMSSNNWLHTNDKEESKESCANENNLMKLEMYLPPPNEQNDMKTFHTKTLQEKLKEIELSQKEEAKAKKPPLHQPKIILMNESFNSSSSNNSARKINIDDRYNDQYPNKGELKTLGKWSKSERNDWEVVEDEENKGIFKEIPRPDKGLDFADNAKYKGDYRDGMKHDKGVFTWADGRVYEGSYVNDKKEGGDSTPKLIKNILQNSSSGQIRRLRDKYGKLAFSACKEDPELEKSCSIDMALSSSSHKRNIN